MLVGDISGEKDEIDLAKLEVAGFLMLLLISQGFKDRRGSKQISACLTGRAQLTLPTTNQLESSSSMSCY